MGSEVKQVVLRGSLMGVLSQGRWWWMEHGRRIPGRRQWHGVQWWCAK